MSFMLYSDFSLFSDNLKLGPVFTLSGMDFQDVPGSPAVSFVNQTSGLNGLQFPDTGIEVNLPVAVPWARVHIGQFATPFTIEGIDTSGNAINTYALNKPNTYWFVNFYKGDLAMIRFAGGGNEGIIVSVCILVP